MGRSHNAFSDRELSRVILLSFPATGCKPSSGSLQADWCRGTQMTATICRMTGPWTFCAIKHYL